MRNLVFIILWAVQGCHASEPSKGWSDWFSEGKSLRNAGNYTAAAHAFREALTTAEHSELKDLQLVELHNALAAAYAEAGQFAESEGEYRCALVLVEKSEGQASLNYAVVLASLAVLPTQTGDREPVISLLRNALAVNARSGAVENLALVRGCLALVLRSQKRYQEEEPLLLDAIAYLEGEKAVDPQLMSGFLNDLGVLRFDQGRYQESVDLQQRSIRTLEAALGAGHPSLVVPLNNLAATYVKMGRFDDASVTYQGAIDVCRKTLGQDHLDYAVLLENYGFVLRKLGRKRDAKKAASEGQQIQRAVNRRNGAGATISLTGLRSDRALSDPR